MFWLLLYLLGQIFCVELRVNRLSGWDYINLHCRDNQNVPVDWWMLYKPPSGDLPWELGLNYSYISSVNAGKWISSSRRITGDSMLQHTLAPMFRRTYKDHLAIMSYTSKGDTKWRPGSAAMGLMLADELSGIWIIHTVPGLPDLTDERVYFPVDELKNGHLIVCLSANFTTLNELSIGLRKLEPKVQRFHMPKSMTELLSDWVTMGVPIRQPANVQFPHKTYDFETKEKTLQAKVVVRHPKDKSCLYQTFAKKHNIVLDVYGHHKETPAFCESNYSIRNIDSISIKYPNYINDPKQRVPVHYIDNDKDRLEFAVSTAGPWQHRGGNTKPEYWACVGASDVDDAKGRGAFILCIEDYAIWRSFDILKIKEPDCYYIFFIFSCNLMLFSCQFPIPSIIRLRKYRQNSENVRPNNIIFYNAIKLMI